MFDHKLSQWPWSDLGLNCAMHIILWYFTFVPSHFKMSPTLQELYRQTHNTVRQCLTLNYDLDIEPTLVKHMQFTFIILDICAFICKSHQRIKWYKADRIVCLPLNCYHDLEVTMVKHALCTLSHGPLHLCQVILKCKGPW